MRSAPSSQAVAATARGWLEHRSKLGHYPSTIRFSWIIAGALDNLRQGEVSQARARLALALAAVDQAALDGGSWSLANEFLLEVPPPFSAFQNRRAPDPSEQVATRLVEDRFLDVKFVIVIPTWSPGNDWLHLQRFVNNREEILLLVVHHILFPSQKGKPKVSRQPKSLPVGINDGKRRFEFEDILFGFAGPKSSGGSSYYSAFGCLGSLFCFGWKKS